MRDHPKLPAVVWQVRELCGLIHIYILESDHARTDALRLPDDCVLDGAKLLLLRQWRTLALLLRIEVLYLTLELPPRLIALVDDGQLFHLINDFVYDFLHLFWKVAVFFLAFHGFQLGGQRYHHRFHLWMAAKAGPHLLCQSFHFLSGPAHQFISGGGLLLVGVEQLLFENIVCQRGLDFADAILGEISLTVIRVRPATCLQSI